MPALAQAQIWHQLKHDPASDVINLVEAAANAWQSQALCRERTDAVYTFDKLKNQRDLNGF